MSLKSEAPTPQSKPQAANFEVFATTGARCWARIGRAGTDCVEGLGAFGLREAVRKGASEGGAARFLQV